MSVSHTIGVWHEREAREITRCPSYYAADTETLRTTPGDYPARLTFEGGFTVPMPRWLLVTVPSVRVSGRLYSGFCGNNFAHTDLKAGEPVDYHVQAYDYMIRDLVEAGRLTLAPEYQWILDEKYPHQSPRAPKTWEQLAAMKGGE